MEADCRHKRQWSVLHGTVCGAANDPGALGTDHQYLGKPGNHAPSGILALWSVQGGIGIRDDHLVAKLAGTGVTVNALLPGGPTRTGMVPDGVSNEVRSRLLDPEVMVPPLLWLISTDADPITGMRIVANRWRADLSVREAAQAAAEPAGC